MNNKTVLNRPRSFSDSELRKVDVEIVDLSSGMLGCLECGRRWIVNQPPRGKRHYRGYWKCPDGCNSE